MSFGFGLGLPHYVAVLGGASPPSETYFLSLTSSSTAGVGLEPNTLTVDGSGNVVIFGRKSGSGSGTSSGYALKLTNAGALSISDKLSQTVFQFGGYSGAIDGSGNYYVGVTYGLICGSPTIELLKLDSSFTKLAGINISIFCNYGYQYGTVTKDSSGNIWELATDAYSSAVVIVNSALSSANYYAAFVPPAGGYGFYTSTASISSGSMILAGYRYYTYSVGCCCVNEYYPVIQSVSVASPTSAPNWTWELPTNIGNTSGFVAVTVDSSNNIYTAISNTLFKFNSSGALQWQNTYTGVQFIQSIACDSSGNVYCLCSTGAVATATIIKINTSGTLQYSRTLTATSGAAGLTTYLGTAYIYINGSTMYVTTGLLPASTIKSVLTLKVPTNGDLTQSISVGGYSFTYAVGSVTSSAASYTLTAKTGYNLSGGGAVGAGSLVNVSSDAASTAVTVL